MPFPVDESTGLCEFRHDVSGRPAWKMFNADGVELIPFFLVVDFGRLLFTPEGMAIKYRKDEYDRRIARVEVEERCPTPSA